MDTVTRVTTQSWFDRQRSAAGGVCCGLLLFGVSVPMLFWNEGRAVKRHQTLQEGIKAVVHVDTDVVDPDNEGKLVHFSGAAVTSNNITDPIFGVTTDTLKLRRNVVMFQWVEDTEEETRKKVGGGTETVTTYSYRTSWENHPVYSNNFQEPVGHENPGTMPFTGTVTTADPITVGAFKLPNGFINKLSWYAPLATAIDTETIADKKIRKNAQPYAGGFYIGKDPNYPEVGDSRVTFDVVQPGDISGVARQSGDTFAPYLTKVGGTIFLLQRGTYTPEEMFQQAEQDNETMTWFIRFLGIFLMGLGFNQILRPLAVAGDVIPCIGDLIGAGAALLSFLLAAIVSFIIIGVAWLFYRPLIAGSLLAVTAALVFFVVKKMREGKTNGQYQQGTSVEQDVELGGYSDKA